ncbi:amino acid transporter [Fusarium acutatum]|uniref:Amino acid transporter n=1 Tax=Fusarium acutatum TaxID=78861 RepID=A0A8H4NFN5_9HYPO|nr:amino acid transporter [Fusarium acutatum]
MTDQQSHQDSLEKKVNPRGSSPSFVSDNATSSSEVRLNKSSFSMLGAIGVQWGTAAAPLTICANLQLVVGVGGSPFYFWGFVVSSFFQFLLVLSLAELASCFPHTSGPAFWVANLAPKRYSLFLTYWVGMTTTWGWLFGMAGSAIYAGQYLISLGVINDSSVTGTKWQIYLLVLGIGIASFVINTVGFKILRKIMFPLMITFNLATVFIFVTLLAKASPKASASTVFIDVTNHSGWPNDVAPFLINLLPGSVALSLLDGATHASDEMPEPAVQVPKVMVGTTILNILSTFVMLIGVLFCLKSPETLLEPLAGIAFLQLCYNAWPNNGFVTTIAAIFSLGNISSVFAFTYACSRMIWAFSQTGGINGREWLMKVQPGLKVPLNAVITTITLLVLTCLLVLGPETVMNAIFGAGGFFFVNSYGIPVLLLLLKGRDSLPANRSFNLGQLGWVINVLAVLWGILIMVVSNFPTSLPVTLSSMNWASACVGVCALVSFANWFLVRKTWVPPAVMYTIEYVHFATRE